MITGLFLVCALLWFKVWRERAQAQERASEIKSEDEDEAEAIDPQRALDVEHYKRQLDLYYEQLWEAEDYLERAREAVKLDRELNKYGAVVKDKAYEQHRKDYQKWLGKVATINNKIYATERRLNK